MRGHVLLASLLALAACAEHNGKDPKTDEETSEQPEIEAADAALPPLEKILPEPVTYPDIEKYDMFGASCAYARDTGAGALVIARAADAFLKIEGAVVRLLVDRNSADMPSGTRAHYSSPTLSLQLTIESNAREDPLSIGTSLYDGTVSLRDAWDREIYRGKSKVSCGV